MTAPDFRTLVLAHLENPLKPLEDEAFKRIASLVNHPLKTPEKGGGLTQEGKRAFAGDKEVLEKGQTHRENQRVRVQAVIVTCQLFLAQLAGKATPEGNKTLLAGITIQTNGKLDQIRTTRKNGSTLSGEFKEMMASAFKALKGQNPAAVEIIKAAAFAQQAQEKQQVAKAEMVQAMA